MSPEERIRKHAPRYKEIIERLERRKRAKAGKSGKNRRGGGVGTEGAEQRASGIENAREQTGSEKPDRRHGDRQMRVGGPEPGGGRAGSGVTGKDRDKAITPSPTVSFSRKMSRQG